MTPEAAHWAVESWALALGAFTQPLPAAKPAPVSSPSPPPIVPKVKPTAPLRVAETLMAGRYQDNGDGTVTDVQTGLQWMRFSLGQEWKNYACTGQPKKYTWQAAMDAAEALNHQGGYAGYRDWRVPKIEELLTLVYCSGGLPKTWNDTGEPCQGNYEHPYIYKYPNIYQPAFPNTSFLVEYWSSSILPNYPDLACLVYFGSGCMYEDNKDFDGYHARLVRGGQ